MRASSANHFRACRPGSKSATSFNGDSEAVDSSGKPLECRTDKSELLSMNDLSQSCSTISSLLNSCEILLSTGNLLIINYMHDTPSFFSTKQSHFLILFRIRVGIPQYLGVHLTPISSCSKRFTTLSNLPRSIVNEVAPQDFPTHLRGKTSQGCININ